MALVGWVREKGNKSPVPNVQIQVTNIDDQTDEKFGGPFTGSTNSNGDYTIVIGPPGDVGKIRFKAEVIGGPGVISEDKPEWESSKDCHDSSAVQVMRVNWGRKNN